MVAVGGLPAAPHVILRRRVELADRAIAGSVQPYHAAEPMELKQAKAYLKRCGYAASAMAKTTVREAVAELAGQDYSVSACCVLLGSGRPAGDLAATLASHLLIHSAEGEFFREAIKEGCQASGLVVSGIREKELWERGAAALGMSTEEVQRRVSELGKSIGPPWRQDEKMAALAGWIVIAG
jgi:hypothetical protein